MGSKRKREIPLSLSDRREEKMGSKKVTLKSSDGQVFEVDEAAALESQVIKMMIEDNCANGVIPLPKVTSKILSKVIEYCEKHVEMQKPGEDKNPLDEDLKSWDADFVKVDMQTLLDLIDAADYLIMESLVDLTSQGLTDMLQLVGKAVKAHVEKEKEKEKEKKEKKETRLLAIMAHVKEQRGRTAAFTNNGFYGTMGRRKAAFSINVFLMLKRKSRGDLQADLPYTTTTLLIEPFK